MMYGWILAPEKECPFASPHQESWESVPERRSHKIRVLYALSQDAQLQINALSQDAQPQIAQKKDAIAWEHAEILFRDCERLVEFG